MVFGALCRAFSVTAFRRPSPQLPRKNTPKAACAACGALVPARFAYCDKCGAQLTEKWPFCPEMIKAEAKKCRFCGESLKPQLPPRQPAAPRQPLSIIPGMTDDAYKVIVARDLEDLRRYVAGEKMLSVVDVGRGY